MNHSLKVQSVLSNLDSGLHQKFLEIRLEDLPGSIRPNILRRLEGIGVKTIHDLIDMPVVEFMSLKGIWAKQAEELVSFKALAFSDPQGILDLYESGLPRVFPTKEYSNNFIVLFKNILEDYFSTQSPREINIFSKRFSLDGSHKRTLQELGTELGITRERTRQLVNVHLSALRQLINNELVCLKKEDFTCSEEALSLFLKIKDILLSKEYFLKEEFLSCIKASGIDVESSKSDDPYLMLFLHMVCPQVYEFNNSFVLVSCDKESSEDILPDLNLVSKKIRDILNGNPVWMKDQVLYKKLKKTFKSLDFGFLKFCCGADDTIEVSKKEETESYQIKATHLRSVASLAYRTLYENKKTMHASEIFKIISSSYEFSNNNQSSPQTAVSNRLHYDDRFTPIGKTGFWSLTSWGSNSQCLHDLVKSTLEESGKPLSLVDIYKIVVKKRPEIKYQSMISILALHKDIFAYTEGRLLILRSWAQYHVVDHKKRELLPGPELDKILPSVFKGTEELTSNQIQIRLKKVGLDLSRSSLSTKLNSSPLLTKRHKGIQNFYSLVEGASPRTAEVLKRDLMVESAKNLILESFTKKVKLSEIVGTVEKSHNFNRYSMYGLINEYYGFIKETLDDGVVVSLK